MRVCDYCREPRALTEIIIPDRAFTHAGEIKPGFDKHEICNKCALELSKKIAEWIMENNYHG